MLTSVTRVRRRVSFTQLAHTDSGASCRGKAKPAASSKMKVPVHSKQKGKAKAVATKGKARAVSKPVARAPRAKRSPSPSSPSQSEGEEEEEHKPVARAIPPRRVEEEYDEEEEEEEEEEEDVGMAKTTTTDEVRCVYQNQLSLDCSQWRENAPMISLRGVTLHSVLGGYATHRWRCAFMQPELGSSRSVLGLTRHGRGATGRCVGHADDRGRGADGGCQ